MQSHVHILPYDKKKKYIDISIYLYLYSHTPMGEPHRKPKVENFTVVWPQTLPKTTNPISRGLYLKPVNKSDLLITNQVQVQSLENDSTQRLRPTGLSFGFTFCPSTVQTGQKQSAPTPLAPHPILQTQHSLTTPNVDTCSCSFTVGHKLYE